MDEKRRDETLVIASAAEQSRECKTVKLLRFLGFAYNDVGFARDDSSATLGTGLARDDDKKRTVLNKLKKSTMNRLLLIVLLGLSAVTYGQNADLTVNLPEVTDLGGKALNASSLSTGQELSLRIPVMNMNQRQAAAAGSCRLEIDLGTKLSLDPGFNLSGSALSNYFTWTEGVSASGGLVISGKLRADLPADFMGTAVLNLKCQEPGLSEITLHWVYAAGKLKPSTSKNTTVFQVNVKPGGRKLQY